MCYIQTKRVLVNSATFSSISVTVHISLTTIIQLCVTFNQRSPYNFTWKQSLRLHKEEFEDTKRVIRKWVKLDTLVSYQIRLYNINSLFYLFSDWIYFQINNFIFYVFISWPLLKKLKRWATRIPPKPGDEPRSPWRVNSSCFL